MNTTIVAPGTERLKVAQEFFTAHARLIVALKAMKESAHGVIERPNERASLNALLGHITEKQVELSAFLNSFLPPRSLEQEEFDMRRVGTGNPAENRLCDHAHYSFEKHGRFCTCGTIMWDPGD